MATIQTLNDAEAWVSFRWKLNTNFSNLNADKLEASDITWKQDILAEWAFIDWDKTKLDWIEAGADVTDTTNVTAAWALMDSELASIANVKALDQSVVSWASPVFATTNMTEWTNKNFVTDIQSDKIEAGQMLTDTDCDTVTTGWRYGMIWTPTNWPQAWEFYLEVLVDATGRIMQIATYLDNTIWTRYYDWISAWSTWVVWLSTWTNTWDETTTTMWTLINWADAKVTPVDTDLVPIRDVTGWLLEKVTWANIKATIKAYYDSVTSTFTNKTFDANWTWNSLSNVDVADLANWTDWELITWDATWAPATVAVWTANQVLTSNWVWAAPTFQDAAWWASPLTTKWDVYTYSTTDARLWVWSNWQVLTADSAEVTWLKWATPAWSWDMLAATYDPATISEQLVWLTATQSLSNKTLDDSTTTIADNVDDTKKIAFQASAITTATTRTITMADSDIDLANTPTAWEKTVLGNTSWTNTWDQTISDATITTTDITDNDVSTSKHWFAPKLPWGTTTFLRWDWTYATPSIGSSESVEKTVFNNTWITITKWQAVYVDWWNVWNAVPTVALARADSATTMPAIWIAIADIANNSTWDIMILGSVEWLDTSSYSLDDALYIDPSTAWALTTTKPVWANLIQAVARVTRTHSTAWTIFVAWALRTNDIPNFTAADKYWYGWTSWVSTEWVITTAGRAILDDADASAQRTTLWVAIWTDVQAYDAELAAIAWLTSAAWKLIEFTWSWTAQTIDHTAVKTTESFIIACSDESTALTTGTAKVTFRMPYAFTVSEVRASLTWAWSTSWTTTVDINESWTTILSTKLTIDQGEKTSETAATPPVISDSSLADDAEITIDIDAVTWWADETGLKVTLIWNRT